MTPREFQVQIKERHSNGDYSLNHVEIIKKGGRNGDTFYSINSTDRATRIRDGGTSSLIDINNIPEGDYERYSEIQIIKSGYIEFTGVTYKADMMKLLTDFYHIVESDPNRKLCGMLFFEHSKHYNANLISDTLSYYTEEGTEVHIIPRYRLAEERRNCAKQGIKSPTYGSKLFTKTGWFMGFRIVDFFNAPPEERRSVENQLKEIRFVLDSIPGTKFHDNYIRQWEYLY